MKGRVMKRMIAMLFLCVCVCAQAKTEGVWKTDGIWKCRIANGEATVTECSRPTGALAIPNTLGGCPVTAIMDFAFKDCRDLTSIAMPDSVTAIGGAAFYGCRGLTFVKIPDRVTEIGWRAFYDTPFYADKPKGMVILGSLLYDYKGACPSSVTVPSNVTAIGTAFYGCHGLTSIAVAAGNPNYSSRDGVLFNKDQTELIRFPGGKSGAYEIPPSVTAIWMCAFKGCSGLTSITIPESVTSIGDEAFYGCHGLTSLAIPSGVTTIRDDAFLDCRGLKNIAVAAGNPDYSSRDGVLFNKDQTTLFRFPGGKSGVYEIPPSVTAIRRCAFKGCSGLTSINIPESVTSVGDEAFYGCHGLTNIAVATGNPDYSSRDGILFNKDQTTLFRFPGGKSGAYEIPSSVNYVEPHAFSGCRELTSVAVAAGNPDYSSRDGVLFNRDQTTLFRFPGGKNGSYAIPSSVKCIELDAFGECHGLTSVTIPSNVREIGGWGDFPAFDGCDSLSTIYVEKGDGSRVRSMLDEAGFVAKRVRFVVRVPSTTLKERR